MSYGTFSDNHGLGWTNQNVGFYGPPNLESDQKQMDALLTQLEGLISNVKSRGGQTSDGEQILNETRSKISQQKSELSSNSFNAFWLGTQGKFFRDQGPKVDQAIQSLNQTLQTLSINPPLAATPAPAPPSVNSPSSVPSTPAPNLPAAPTSSPPTSFEPPISSVDSGSDNTMLFGVVGIVIFGALLFILLRKKKKQPMMYYPPMGYPAPPPGYPTQRKRHR